MSRTIIAIAGPLGAGKTTLARELINRHGFEQRGFADPLKFMLRDLVRSQGCSQDEAREMFWGAAKEVPTPYLSGKTPRWAMQSVGTEWGRNLMDPYFWVNIWKAQVESCPEVNFVADDLRFLTEVEAVKSLGGKIVLITRTGHGPGTHSSESEYTKIQEDVLITNPVSSGGGPEEFYKRFVQLWDRYAGGEILPSNHH